MADGAAAILRVNKVNDHYAVLNVARGADADAIKRAYKAHALLLHPDRNDQAGAEDAFKKLLEAYVVLSNAKHRAAYDSGCASQREDDGMNRKRKTAQKATPPTAEELAAQQELDELLARAYQQERHAQWVKQARYEQSSAVLAVLGILLFLVVGMFGWLLSVAWPDDSELASRPQPMQPGWSAVLMMKLRFFGSLIVRVALAAFALILLIVASPYALGFCVFCTGKLCGALFDGFAFLGNKLGPLVEAYVMSHPAGRQRNQAGGGHRKRR